MKLTEHDFEKCAYGWRCKACGREWQQKTDKVTCVGERTYSPDEFYPKTLASRTQLKKMKLTRPPRMEHSAWALNGTTWEPYPLFEIAGCRPTPQPTPAQLAALERGREIREFGLCVGCRKEPVWPGVYYNGLDDLCEKCAKPHFKPCPDCGRTYYGRKASCCDDCLERQTEEADMDNARYIPDPWDGPTVYLDTETTGLNWDAAIVEIAIVDDSGKTLLNNKVNPGFPIPRDATAIHGITNDMVRLCPTLKQLTPRILKAVEGKRVIIYNAAYDMRYIPQEANEVIAKVECCMKRFASFYGEWHNYFKNFTWQNLGVATSVSGYEWIGDSHRALADTLACRHVWLWLDLQSDNS